MNGFTSITRNRTRRGMNGNVSEWLGAVEGLPAVHQRLRRVAIENWDAIRLIEREDGPQTLFYCDPPYAAETRAFPDIYAHEMDPDAHARLLAVLRKCKGKVMLSGYHCPLYDRELRRWTLHEFKQSNHAAGGKKKRRMTECLWCNW
jgi:DNA adenine methylase